MRRGTRDTSVQLALESRVGRNGQVLTCGCGRGRELHRAPLLTARRRHTSASLHDLDDSFAISDLALESQRCTEHLHRAFHVAEITDGSAEAPVRVRHEAPQAKSLREPQALFERGPCSLRIAAKPRHLSDVVQQHHYLVPVVRCAIGLEALVEVRARAVEITPVHREQSHVEHGLVRFPVEAELPADTEFADSLVPFESVADGSTVATRTIQAGEPLTVSAIGAAGSVTGQRVMSIPLEPWQAANGERQVGDTVDVIEATRDGSRYVLTSASVVGRSGGDDSGGLVGGSRASELVILVEVDGPQALDLAAAIEAGTIMVVRSTGAAPITDVVAEEVAE